MNRKNLIKAIEWHENKKGRKWFDFGDVVLKWDTVKQCGSVCCFVGNTGHIFPEIVSWDGAGVYIGNKNYYIQWLACILDAPSVVDDLRQIKAHPLYSGPLL